jgi:cytochrome c biogenesis protein CcmG, thiol:disulfide interchange protein DsbE
VLLPGLAAALAAALVALLAFGLARQGGGDRIEDALAAGTRPPVPATRLPALDGGAPRALADYRGEVVVLNLFASWCAPCKQEAPVLRREQARLRRSGGTVLGVTWRDAAPAARGFARRYGLGFPILRDVSGDFAQRLGVRGVPETFVLDRHGRVAAVRRYPIDAAWLRAAVRRAQAS